MLSIFNNRWVIGSLGAILGLVGAFTFGYVKGSNATQVKLYQQQIAEAKANAVKLKQLNELNQQLTLQNHNNTIKREHDYAQLQQELNQSNANLSACKYNLDSLRAIQRAAANLSSGSAIAEGTKNNTAGESASNYDARIASADMIKWAKMYFACRDQVILINRWYDANIESRI